MIQLQNKWTPNHVNIYFCGAFDGDTNPNNNPFKLPTCFVADPSQFPQPYIVINDGGSWSCPGWLPQGDSRILEHEMTHFLGRFQNLSFPGYEINNQQTTVTYDSGEHAPAEPPEWGLMNILWAGGPVYNMQIGPLEKAEMRSRIIQGTWLNP